MNEDATKADRRFTLLEFVVYVSLFAISFAVIRFVLQHNDSSDILLMLAALALLGALIGLGLGVLLRGRRSAASGAIVGAIVLPTVLFIVLTIAVHRTHRGPRILIENPPLESNEQMDALDIDGKDSERR